MLISRPVVKLSKQYNSQNQGADRPQFDLW